MTVAPWSDEIELAEARRDLARARLDLFRSEQADLHGRVANRGLWRASLRRKRERVEGLAAHVKTLSERLEEE